MSFSGSLRSLSAPSNSIASVVKPKAAIVPLTLCQDSSEEPSDDPILELERPRQQLLNSKNARRYLSRAIMNGDVDVSVRPYAEGDLWLLERTLGDPSQMVHLNGPESNENIRKRHNRFLAMSADPHAGCQFTILAGPLHAPAGNVG